MAAMAFCFSVPDSEKMENDHWSWAGIDLGEIRDAELDLYVKVQSC